MHNGQIYASYVHFYRLMRTIMLITVSMQE